jgi:hexosaminidase
MPSFPFVSTTFPSLSAAGAFDARHVYTPADVAGIVSYAQHRGIRVIPEFDMPDHTFPSWDMAGVLANDSQLLTRCPAVQKAVGGFGPLRVDKESTYTFIAGLLQDVAASFPDPVFNFGGDEVHAACWEANAEVAAFMRARKLNATGLSHYFAQRLLAIVNGTMRKVICWCCSSLCCCNSLSCCLASATPSPLICSMRHLCAHIAHRTLNLRRPHTD